VEIIDFVRIEVNKINLCFDEMMHNWWKKIVWFTYVLYL